MNNTEIEQDDTNFNSPLGVRGTNMFYGASPIHFELAKKLRDNQTEAEMFLWDHLKKYKFQESILNANIQFFILLLIFIVIEQNLL